MYMTKNRRYLLNIKTGKIHDGENLCYRGRSMSEENQKWADSLDELVNFYEGNKKGIACAVCLKNKMVK